MSDDFIIRSERVVTPDGVRAAAVLVRDGRIAAVAPHGDRGRPDAAGEDHAFGCYDEVVGH